MSYRKMAYLLLILNLLTLSIVIMFAVLSMYVDQLSSDYFESWIYYIPKYVYILLGISLIITVLLFLKKEKEATN
ncbi:hypothetical protein CW357_18050 [Rummeliibacillus sp. TYF005]|uniref:hypothetical protein n=1 Tax=Rummeliibacillus sp. TYF005 TaxID=2058214 RepID=UPI000F526794|nr:hypothetical protein [Rummeliibacillus sp. TYF005]RPJ93936.1 hypothetical protein CW357_18050 [Rummeliibacillus sp. TYF005]